MGALIFTGSPTIDTTDVAVETAVIASEDEREEILF